MKKWKMNWGTGIAITLALFIGAMVYTMYLVTQQRFDLVTTNYYEAELAYQETIDRKENALTLSDESHLRIVDGKIELQFPTQLKGQTANAQILLYCQTDARKDFTLTQKDWTVANVPLSAQKMTTGKWIAKVTLDTPGAKYYFEPSIVIP
jgi:hypothetical protein